MTNVPTFAVKVRPADLPQAERPQVVERLAALLGMDAADINATIDSNPGSNFDLVRIAGDVDKNTARLIAEAGFDLPGVEIAVEARRQYTVRPAVLADPRVHRLRSRPTSSPISGPSATSRTT